MSSFIPLKISLGSGDMLEAEITITGRVQGVGFRPFVYREAVGKGLKGKVINLGDAGVEITVEGPQSRIESFIDSLKRNSPRVSEIGHINVIYRTFRDRFEEFSIDKSQNREQAVSGIFPPDIAICDDCVRDMSREGSRWHDYPFTACAWCGPRFTAVRSLPYDRERTHMSEFPMCQKCEAEYRNPMDRRFDAQGITCPLCGPKMILYNRSGQEVKVDDIFSTAAEILTSGQIVAVKGIGGVHLAAIANSDDVVAELRRRKRRPTQPFALMSLSLMEVKSFAHVDEEEEEVLTSWRKPIVLLRKKKGRTISELIAPGLDKVGVMLPYSGIHLMLFKKLKVPALIMTSGNKPGLPMAITNDTALEELRGIADYFLLHDREIYNRCDDSVLSVVRGNKPFLRRSRGYVPEHIDIPIKKGCSLTVGAELRNAAAFSINGKCYLTQYLGDVTNLESLEFEREAIKTFKRILNITRNPDVIGCDLHPDYMTSHLAYDMSQEMDVTLVKSQHHHAHISSVCCEHGVPLDEDVIGIALDGAGYGTDGLIWGGEVIKSNYRKFERLGQLEYLPMPGGDLCTYFPFRMLLAAMTKSATDEEIRDITKNHMKKGLPHGEKEFNLILKQSRRTETIQTSSAGRLLDSIAAITGICYKRTYEGEPAILLESLAKKGDPDKIKLEPTIIENKGIYVLNLSNMLKYLMEIDYRLKSKDIAAFGQKYLAHGMAKIASIAARDKGINTISLSGGVMANEYIATELSDILSKDGFNVLFHLKVPPGDGGTALGQTTIALAHVI